MRERIINTAYFRDFESLIDDVIDRIEYSEEYLSISIIGKYEEIRQLLSAVISNHDVSIEDIELCSENCNGYIDEYLLAIYEDEDIGIVVGCEPLKKNGRYFNYGADMVYILENCSSTVQHYCETDDVRCAVIGEVPDKDCSECHNTPTRTLKFAKDEDGNIHGFSYSKSDNDSYTECSYYSSTNISNKQLKEMFAEFWD